MAQYRSQWTGEVIDDAVGKAKNITYLTIGEDAQGAFAKAEAVYGNSPLYAIKNDSSSRTVYVCSGKTGNQYAFAYSNALGLVTVMLTPTAWQEPIITMYATRERVGNVVAIYENGFTASRNIAKGQYVVWETMLSFGDNLLYTADVDIATGTRLSANGSGKNLTAVSNGGLNDLKSAITQVDVNIATVESSTMASRNYISGEWLVLDGYLYVTAGNISSGATLVPGSNIVQTTIGLLFKEVSISARRYGNSYITPGSGMTVNLNARSVGAMTYAVITMTGDFTYAKLIGTVAYDVHILPKARPFVPLCNDSDGGVVNGHIVYNGDGKIYYYGDSLTNKTLVATIAFMNQTVTDVEQ